MKKKETMPYRTISLPNYLYKEIENHISNDIRYVSIAHFVRVSIDDRIKKDNINL